jgi:hypothetical protein
MLWAQLSAKTWTLWGNYVECGGGGGRVERAGKTSPSPQAIAYGDCKGLSSFVSHWVAPGSRIFARWCSLVRDTQVSCPGRVQRALLRERNETRDPAQKAQSTTFDAPELICDSPASHCGDRLDLQEKIGIGEPAQNTQRAGGRRARKISLQDAARFGHVVRIADVDRDLGDVGDLGAAGGEGLRQVHHHHLGLGLEIVGWQHFSVHVRPDLARAEHEHQGIV